MPRKPTLAQVAALAGVSKMTASRALRDAGDVSASARDKVQAAAQTLGYVGDRVATALSAKTTNLIGVVVPSLSNIVFAQVLAGISDGIADSGLQPVFGITGYDSDTEAALLRDMLSWRPAGLIVTGLDQPDATRTLLQQAGVPVVQIMDTDGDPVDGCVGISHNAAGADMARALLAAGRRRIGYVGAHLAHDTRAAKRLAGFRAALADAGTDLVASRVTGAPSSAASGRDLTATLLSRHPDLDCIYYSNDDMAIGGLFHCQSAGLDVPGHLMIAGFNGLDLVESLPVGIATTVTPRHEIGRRAARMIAEATPAVSLPCVALSARIVLPGSIPPRHNSRT